MDWEGLIGEEQYSCFPRADALSELSSLRLEQLTTHKELLKANRVLLQLAKDIENTVEQGLKIFRDKVLFFTYGLNRHYG